MTHVSLSLTIHTCIIHTVRFTELYDLVINIFHKNVQCKRSMEILVVDAGNRRDESVCQPDQPGCVSSSDHCAAQHRHLLHGLVLCVSFTVMPISFAY